jgi:hypothetical protein
MKKNQLTGLFAVMALFLVACDKDNDLPELSGKLIPVSIRSLEMAADEEETVVRSASLQETSMVSTSIGGGMLLEMKMEREESALRAGTVKPLANNAKFRVIALLHDGVNNDKYVSHGDFTYTAGSPTVYQSAAPFHVPIGVSYDFICISYNDGDLPATTGYTKGSALPALAVNSSSKVNLLWWKRSSAVSINSEDDTNLDITLTQRLAKVQVVLDCSYNGWTITGIDAAKNITMNSNVVNGTMNLVTGDVTGTSGNHTITWPSGSATQRTSNVFYVIPKSVSVTVPTEALTVTGNPNHSKIPVSGGTGTFSMALVRGGNYKLYVKLRTPIWAGSNIYWSVSTQKLTFDVAGTTTNQGFQGMFFKFGSLVAISPKGKDYTSNTLIYVPVSSGSGWATSTVGLSGYSTWTETSPWSAAPTTDIPYMDASYSASEGRNSTLVIDAFQGDVATMRTNLRGDICRYLSKTGAVSGTDEYRLPTSLEFGNDSEAWTGRTDGWVKGGGTFESSTVLESDVSDYGTTVIIDKTSPYNRGYARNTFMGNVTLPASGHRISSDGQLFYVGYAGTYWAGSASNAPGGYDLNFDVDNMSPALMGWRSYAFPVRCVKN